MRFYNYFTIFWLNLIGFHIAIFFLLQFYSAQSLRPLKFSLSNQLCFFFFSFPTYFIPRVHAPPTPAIPSTPVLELLPPSLFLLLSHCFLNSDSSKPPKPPMFHFFLYVFISLLPILPLFPLPSFPKLHCSEASSLTLLTMIYSFHIYHTLFFNLT